MKILNEVKIQEHDSQIYEEAVELLREFEEEQKPSKVKLLNIAEKLMESVKENQSHAKSYFLLSYIFYVLNNNVLAEKYLNIAEGLKDDPGFSEFRKLLPIV